jgi:hypothetical protein
MRRGFEAIVFVHWFPKGVTGASGPEGPVNKELVCSLELSDEPQKSVTEVKSIPTVI